MLKVTTVICATFSSDVNAVQTRCNQFLRFNTTSMQLRVCVDVTAMHSRVSQTSIYKVAECTAPIWFAVQFFPELTFYSAQLHCPTDSVRLTRMKAVEIRLQTTPQWKRERNFHMGM